MLKIKDNVDLKELEKFGFEECEYTHLLSLRVDDGTSFSKVHDYMLIDIRDRKIDMADVCNLTYNKVYDLITADLVEKAEEQ